MHRLLLHFFEEEDILIVDVRVVDELTLLK